jgi:hypothetical protein
VSQPSFLWWSLFISAVAAAALTRIAAVVMIGVVPMAVIVVIVAGSRAAIVGAAGAVGTGAIIIALTVANAGGTVHAPGGRRINVQLFDLVGIAVVHGFEKRITVLAPHVSRLSRHYCWRVAQKTVASRQVVTSLAFMANLRSSMTVKTPEYLKRCMPFLLCAEFQPLDATDKSCKQW